MAVLKLPTLEGEAKRNVVVAIDLLRRAHEAAMAELAQVKRDALETQAQILPLEDISQALSSGGVAPVIVTNTQGGLPPSPDDPTVFLNGDGTPKFSRVRDRDLGMADVTINDATTAQHGFLPKLSGVATEFLNGLGLWVTGAAATGGFYAPVTNGDPLSPELLFDSNGEVIMGWEPHP